MALRARSGKWLVGAAVLLLAAAGLLWSLSAAEMNQPSQAPAGTRITVRPGASLRGVLTQLAAVRVLEHPRLVEAWLRLHGEQPSAKAGNYELPVRGSVRQILAQLQAGQVVLEQLTIVEGWTLAQMRQAIDANSALTHEWRELDAATLLAALGDKGGRGASAEGRFYPDSYRFAAGTSDRRIYELAWQRMNERLQQEWEARAPRLPLRSPAEALILASIVERETGREDERARVAAVFINRLRLGMRLQSDPTIIYGLGARYDGNLRRRDLESDGPYNSYTRGGLPPTPIALPGGASLHATLHPASEGVLYFVATGNGDGSHHFSTTYAEHSAALRAFLQRTGATPDRAAGGDHP
jgi:UPF0755 protein